MLVFRFSVFASSPMDGGTLGSLPKPFLGEIGDSGRDIPFLLCLGVEEELALLGEA